MENGSCSYFPAENRRVTSYLEVALFLLSIVVFHVYKENLDVAKDRRNYLIVSLPKLCHTITEIKANVFMCLKSDLFFWIIQ